MHPHSGPDDAQRARLEELHRAVGDLLGPIARSVMHVEALWLGSRRDFIEFKPHNSGPGRRWGGKTRGGSGRWRKERPLVFGVGRI
jgi:hypothetical protein